MGHTMLIEKYFLKNNSLKNTIIKTSFIYTRTYKFWTANKTFLHYAFSSVGTPDGPSQNLVCERLV